MKDEKLPFEITPQIQRYLEDILFWDKEYLFDENYTGGVGKELLCLVVKEYPGELETPRQRQNRGCFLRYLINQNSIKMFVTGDMFLKDTKLSPLREKQLKQGKSIKIAISKNEKDENNIKFFWAKPNSWQEDFKNLINLNHHKYVVFKILDIKPVEKLLEKIKSGENFTNEKTQQTQQIQDKDTQSAILPDGTKWRDITIQFMGNGDNVEISTKKSSDMANYQKMGFEDTRKRRPNAQWQFLRLLALPQFGGELSWEKLNAGGITNPKEQANYKKKKQLLAKTLKNYFQIREDPFFSYRKEGAYKIKINLISSPDQQEVRQYEDEDGISSETKAYLDENAPSVYEEEKDFNNNV